MQNPLYKQFNFKQFILALVRSLNVKTVIFQTIQFSISTQFSFILTIDRTLSSATILVPSKPGSDGNKGYSKFPKVPALLETQHQIH